MEPSQEYLDAVAKGTQFQLRESAWAGYDAKNYAEEIKCLRKHYKARTLLDYGCGKGHQYTVKSPPFDKVTGFRSYYLFCLLYTSPSPRDRQKSRMPSSA